MPVATMNQPSNDAHGRPNPHSSSSIHLHSMPYSPQSAQQYAGYPSPTQAYGSTQQQQQQQLYSPPQEHYSPSLPQEFLINIEIWTSFGSSKGGKKIKSSRSRPSSTLGSLTNASGANGSASTSQDDLALAHSLSATTDGYSHYSHAHSLASTVPGSTTSSKKGLSSIFSSSSAGVSELGTGSSAGAEKAAKAGASGFWRAAVAKLSGEVGVWPGQPIPGSNPTGSALLTLYSASDNTLQHVINVHKLTSTDVRPVDKSLFGRSDVLAIWGHPGAMSLSTNPTLDPIYLSFPSTDAHNTWLVLLRSYTSPEIYGKMIEAGRAQGGLYRMWRQIELVVLQTRGVGLTPPNTSTIGSGGPPTITTTTKEKKSLGNLFGKDKDDSSRPGTATSAQTTLTYTTTNTGSTITGSGSTDNIPLALTQSHTTGTTASYTSTSASFTMSSSQSMTERTESGDSASEGGNSPVLTRGRSGEQTPLAMGTQTPTPANASQGMRSYSTTSLPTSEGETSLSSHHHHAPPPVPVPGANPQQLTSALSASRKREDEKRREKEAREKEKEKERKEKEKKEREREREKEREKELRRLPSLFAEIILDGEVAGRTTIKKCVPPLPPSRSGAATPTPSGSAGTQGAPGPDWFENFLFPDLPSFGNLVVGVWKAPEGKKEKEKDGEKAKSTTSLNSSSTYSGLTGNASTVTGLTSHTGSSAATGSTAVSVGKKSITGPSVYGGSKGTQFLGSVEISVPNFRRGEWVEGWWPVYAHANTLSGASGPENKGPNQHGIGNLGIGTGAMGMGGMSGVGGAAGALVQVGELKLRIKVDEEIILPSKSYKNVLDALEKRNYLDVLSDLEQKLRIDHGMISNHIVSLAVARNRLLKDIVQLAEREVMAIQGSTNTLFRGNTILTKTMELAMAWYGRGFLDASVGPIIRRMIAENVEIEVDPSKLPSSGKRPSTRDSYRPSTKESVMGGDKDSLQEQGIRLLEYWCNELWSQIYVVRMECPVELRRLFGHIRLMVERRFGVSGRQMDIDPDDPTSPLRINNVSQGADMLPWQAISSFVFLRFLVPAILNPHLSNLCQGIPSRGVVRSLTLLAKCTQSLANLNPGAPQKEEYMRGIRACLERNTITMIDYLSCVSSLPDQFSPTANSSSFLSGPDKHDRLHVISSLRERLTGAGGSSIPTLYKDAIPLLPYALDVPKHLAILSSAVVRNARTGGTAYGGRSGSAGVGAEEADNWSLSRFSELCFDVEAQALKSVATLAQGAASAGAFGGPRAKRSTSVSSAGGFQQSGSGAQQRPNSSRGVTPTGPKTTAGTASGMATTPTQTSPGPWPSQKRRPASARSAIASTQPPHASNNSPGPSPGGRNVPSDSPVREPTVTLMPPSKKRQSMRPSTAPSATSTGSSPSPSDPFFRERTARIPPPESSPAAASFRYLPPEQSHDPRRAEDVLQPEPPISPGQTSYGSHGRHGYPTMHRGESESYIPYHYPSRYQGSAEALRATLAATPSAKPAEKNERRSSAGRIKDFMRRPATSSGSPSASAPSSATAQRAPWTWEGSSPTGRGEHTPHSSSGEDYPVGSQPRGKRGSSGKGSLGASSGEAYGSSSRKKIDRTDTSTSNETKKKKGLFGWLGKK